MAKEIQARRTRVQTPEITRQPTQQTKLVPRQVPEFRSTMAGLEGLNAAFANFFGQASKAIDNVNDAIAVAERQRILRENEAQKAQAVGDALTGRPMDAEGANDYDYYDTYRSVLAEKTGVDAVREFQDWYQSDFLVNNPDGDLSEARQEWAKQHLAGSDDPEFEGMALGTFFKSTETVLSQHREARTKALFAKGADNLQSVIDNDVEQGALTPERLTAHIQSMRTLDPLNATEAAPRVAAQLATAIQNHPQQSEAVLKTITMPGTGINGKSFQDSFPEAYAKLQEAAVKSWEQTNTFAEAKAVDALRERARGLSEASDDELIKYHVDLTETRNTYGAVNDIAQLEAFWAKEIDRRVTEKTTFSHVQGMLTGTYQTDVDVLQKNLGPYMKKVMGIDNILQAEPADVAAIFAKTKGVVPPDFQKQLSGALMSFENPDAQARAVRVLSALEGARNRDYVNQWLDEPAERLYQQIADEQQLTGESLETSLMRAAERRRNGKPFDSWSEVITNKTPAEANKQVRDTISSSVKDAFSNEGFLGLGRNDIFIPPDVNNRIESYAKSVVAERGAQGVDVDAAIKEAVQRTIRRGEVLPQGDRYVLSMTDNRPDAYEENGKLVPRIRLGFREMNPNTGEVVNTLDVYRSQLSELGSKLPQVLPKGTTDDIALTTSPLTASAGGFAVAQGGNPVVYEMGKTFEVAGRKVTFTQDEAELRKQFDGLLPQGFGFTRLPIGFDKFGWMLSYRPNYGDQGGVTLEQRERDWKPAPSPAQLGQWTGDLP